VFSPALWNGFVEWDDHINLVQNLNYRGLGWEQLRWMLSTTLMGHYIPVTWVSFGLDYALWQMTPFGYHLTNCLVHALNAAVFYLVARRLLARATAVDGHTLTASASTAALFFAIHPLRAESVAWVTERRDVLSGLFSLLTVLAYLKSTAAVGPLKRRLSLVAIACYALALGSKAMVMTLPLVLLLLDVHPLRRIPPPGMAWLQASARSVLKEKLPYLALGLAGAIASYLAVSAHDFLTSFDRYPWSARLGMALYSLWFYIAKTAVPSNLSPLYELPARVDLAAPRFLGAAVGVLSVSGLVLALARRWPSGLAVWTYYVVALAPVAGIIHSGFQLAHDRYSYLPCLGWALLAGGGAGLVAQGLSQRSLRPWLVYAARATAASWIVAHAILTWYQVQVWRSTETLWRHAVEAEPGCAICRVNMGDHFLRLGLGAAARDQYEWALRLRPDRMKAHANLGLALADLGDIDGALRHLQVAAAKYPSDLAVLNNLASVLLTLARPMEALAQLDRVLRLDPEHVPALTNRGAALTAIRQPDAALRALHRAAEIRPDDPIIVLNLTRAYLAVGKRDDARMHHEMLRRLDARRARLLEPEIARGP
jgi:tetratricopeptide (TPR) repeat protein